MSYGERSQWWFVNEEDEPNCRKSTKTVCMYISLLEINKNNNCNDNRHIKQTKRQQNVLRGNEAILALRISLQPHYYSANQRFPVCFSYEI